MLGTHLVNDFDQSTRMRTNDVAYIAGRKRKCDGDSAMTRTAKIIPPGEGRVYAMGRMRAVFKADTDETANLYSLSEWWLEPRTGGPGPHEHEDEHIYYVIEGVLSVLVDGSWSEAGPGSYILIPGGTPHSFENRGTVRAGFMSINVPGGFEEKMPAIAEALGSTDLKI